MSVEMKGRESVPEAFSQHLMATFGQVSPRAQTGRTYSKLIDSCCYLGPSRATEGYRRRLSMKVAVGKWICDTVLKEQVVKQQLVRFAHHDMRMYLAVEGVLLFAAF